MSMLLIIFVPLFIQIRRAQAQQKVQVESRQMQMDPRLSQIRQPQQTGSRARASSLPATAFNKVSRTQTVSKTTLSPFRETQQEQGSGGQEQERQESSSNCVDVAAALPV